MGIFLFNKYIGMNIKILLAIIAALLLVHSVDAQSAITPYGKNTKVGKFVTIRGFNMYY